MIAVIVIVVLAVIDACLWIYIWEWFYKQREAAEMADLKNWLSQIKRETDSV